MHSIHEACEDRDSYCIPAPVRSFTVFAGTSTAMRMAALEVAENWTARANRAELDASAKSRLV